MRKKHAPEQYAAKPKGVVVKSSTPRHPAFGVAKALVSWMARGGVPPSIILLHGLNLARRPENDGLPVDTYRPQLEVGHEQSLVFPRSMNYGFILCCQMGKYTGELKLN